MSSMKFNEEVLNTALVKYQNKAEEYATDPFKLEQLLSKVKEWISKMLKYPVIKNIADDLLTMISLLEDYVKGIYLEVPRGIVISIIAALIYLVSPIDLVPDWLGIAGILDDIAIIKLVLKIGVSSDLDKYRMFKQLIKEKSIADLKIRTIEYWNEKIGNNIFVAAFKIDDDIEVLFTDELQQNTPVECYVIREKMLVSLYRELNMDAEEVASFYNDVFMSNRFKYSILGMIPFGEERNYKTFEEDFIIIGEGNE